MNEQRRSDASPAKRTRRCARRRAPDMAEEAPMTTANRRQQKDEHAPACLRLQRVHIPLLRCVTSLLASYPCLISSGYLIVRCIFILFLRTLVTHSPSLYHHFRAMSAVGGANNPNGSLHTLMMRSSTPGAPRVFSVLIIAVRSCPP